MKMFDELITKIHNGINPYTGYPKEHWLVEHFGGWGSGHDYFRVLIERLKPRLVIEVGSFLGGSAITMGELLKAGGAADRPNKNGGALRPARPFSV